MMSYDYDGVPALEIIKSMFSRIEALEIRIGVLEVEVGEKNENS